MRAVYVQYDSGTWVWLPVPLSGAVAIPNGVTNGTAVLFDLTDAEVCRLMGSFGYPRCPAVETKRQVTGPTTIHFERGP